MFGKGIFRKKPQSPTEPDSEALQNIFQLVDGSAVAVSGNTLLRLAKLGATELDECLQRLVSDGKLEIAYEKRGMDGINRPYYRVSEKYKLLDVKDRVSDFMKLVVKRAKPFVENNHNYYVRVPHRKELSMVFDRRQDARDYRRLLLESRLKLRTDITEQVFEDGLQVERKVS